MAVQSQDAIVTGGFDAPVFDAQSVFRALMDAMARPGTVQAIAPRASAPSPLGPVAAALALTLCDVDTPVWLDAALATDGAIARWLGFHAGAPVTDDPAAAAFALIGDGPSLGSLDRFARGTHDYPDRSATLIVQVPDLAAGPALTLTGPGIKQSTALAPSGLPARFTTLWADNNALFPCGIDMVLATPDAVAALPRTTRIQSTEN
ncbi:MAG: phosphonate C-P lyase system protein PhnH [Roseitalea sp.]|jgi:alpha-D-ribose 1-methylphosphonate 5-triphosphate synthase subunit PhnH|nr:phosphonate C-P lyase system protein PhnH [Roseitalea sp.]MBO6723380.1 phosphonate C-P lyase system protein PhnH [Roseitalea sp.]MBO6744782.1 phosphonate C-P lyase system protein PhnH [Roseitalea sp.]